MAKQTLGDSTCVTIGGSMLDVQVLTVLGLLPTVVIAIV